LIGSCVSVAMRIVRAQCSLGWRLGIESKNTLGKRGIAKRGDVRVLAIWVRVAHV